MPMKELLHFTTLRGPFTAKSFMTALLRPALQKERKLSKLEDPRIRRREEAGDMLLKRERHSRRQREGTKEARITHP